MDKRRQHDDETTINLCTATEYILDDIQIWEVVALSIVCWNEETRSLIRFIFYLSNKQQINQVGYQATWAILYKNKLNLSQIK